MGQGSHVGPGHFARHWGKKRKQKTSFPAVLRAAVEMRLLMHLMRLIQKKILNWPKKEHLWPILGAKKIFGALRQSLEKYFRLARDCFHWGDCFCWPNLKFGPAAVQPRVTANPKQWTVSKNKLTGWPSLHSPGWSFRCHCQKTRAFRCPALHKCCSRQSHQLPTPVELLGSPR